MFSVNETHLVLKPLEKFITNIKCEKSRSIGKYLFFTLDVLYVYSSIGDKKVSLNRSPAATTLEEQTNYMCTVQRRRCIIQEGNTPLRTNRYL